ncbi:MAG: 3-oxoacyl-[acyl-carrier-protein] synthase II [Pseudolabrys sp.]|jgi:3-oxoacyl-[acyl-carrier-protein] synthase II|nr:3-oxoacyl-[acyl-carrier-protein] synthase II [Pseudolabrys sp.]
MTDAARDGLITGIGIVSCLGEGPDAHWQKLMAGETVVDATSFAPYPVHPLTPLDFDKQIPKKGDQRQMEPWQRIGTYAAGLALDSAGIKGNADVLSHTDMIVAAGGGERDLAADSGIMSALPTAANRDALLNEKLMSDLRPTLFLAQLSNLLAGNISIVHNVTGSSRTFMGEESSGIDALRIALARINAGQAEVALAGGSYSAERKDQLMLYAFGDMLLKGEEAPVWARGPKGGLVMGSLGAFLVIESRAHAQARNAKAFAKLSAVMADRSSRQGDPVAPSLRAMWSKIAPGVKAGGAAILSGAAGAEPATSGERAFLNEHPDIPVRATGSYIGHAMEPSFPMNVALAALALNHGKLFPPRDTTGFEKPMAGSLTQVAVTGVGYWRGEGLALLETA